jgi:uncharacterized membrane protein
MPRPDATLTAAGLGALSGLRSMAAPAALGYALSSEDEELLERIKRLLPGARSGTAIERALRSRAGARLMPVLLASEVVADKLPFIPERIDPLPLLVRATIGGLGGWIVSRRERVPGAAPIAAGALAAVAATVVAYHVRRRLSKELDLPDALLGAIEDAVVFAGGAAVAKRLR